MLDLLGLITVVVLLRCLLRGQFRLFKRRLATRQTKRMLTSGALRVHYIPVMFEQVYLGVTAITLQAQTQAEQVQFGITAGTPQAYVQPFTIVLVLTALAWLIDSNNASIGYFWESRFSKTCFRAVDPHP